MRCGKSLIVPANPKNPTQLNTILGHYSIGELFKCIECHEGELKEKRKVHQEQWELINQCHSEATTSLFKETEMTLKELEEQIAKCVGVSPKKLKGLNVYAQLHQCETAGAFVDWRLVQEIATPNDTF
jgi:hypothetical protein